MLCDKQKKDGVFDVVDDANKIINDVGMSNCYIEGNSPNGCSSWSEWFELFGSKGILHNLKLSSLDDKQTPMEKLLTNNYLKNTHPHSNITVEDLINFHRENINLKRNLSEHYIKYQKEGYEHGRKIALMHVEEDTIQYSDLRKMTIQELANWIESYE